MSRAGTDNDANAEPKTRAEESLMTRTTTAWRQLKVHSDELPLIVGGYLIVLVFAAVWVVARSSAVALSDRDASIAGLVSVAPLLAALLLPRLKSVNVAGIEAVFVEAREDGSAAIPMDLMNLQSSVTDELLTAIRSLVRRQARVLEIDLRWGDYWWPTRLYLVARIAQIIGVDHLYVVEGHRSFVGRTTPPVLAGVLEDGYPWLRMTFTRAQDETGVSPIAADDGVAIETAVATLLNWWQSSQAFGSARPQVTEAEFAKEWDMTRVSSGQLRRLFCGDTPPLDTRAVEWPGKSMMQVAREVEAFGGRFVPLLHFDALDAIVDSDQLGTVVGAR